MEPGMSSKRLFVQPEGVRGGGSLPAPLDTLALPLSNGYKRAMQPDELTQDNPKIAKRIASNKEDALSEGKTESLEANIETREEKHLQLEKQIAELKTQQAFLLKEYQAQNVHNATLQIQLSDVLLFNQQTETQRDQLLELQETAERTLTSLLETANAKNAENEELKLRIRSLTEAKTHILQDASRRLVQCEIRRQLQEDVIQAKSRQLQLQLQEINAQKRDLVQHQIEYNQQIQRKNGELQQLRQQLVAKEHQLEQLQRQLAEKMLQQLEEEQDSVASNSPGQTFFYV
ncbi:hypothetical protein ACHQM5_025269 [Ranunculus cassubicifolius]